MWDNLAQVPHVIVANLSSALCNYSGEEDGIHLAVWDPESVLLATKVLNELVIKASI